MTFIICLLFAAGLFIAFEFDEEVLFERHLEVDQLTFIQQYAIAPEIAEIPAGNFEVYITSNGDKSHFPDYLKDLTPEEDDIIVNGKALEIEIMEGGGNTFYFVTEETDMENFEHFLMVSVFIIIIIISLMAVVLGDTLASHIIKPVTRLAEEVNALEATDVRSAGQMHRSKDEIEILSHAIDSFQGRVKELLTRERDFSSDVSHELRTPLMGIQAAAENLQVNNDNADRVMELALRIEARCKQMKSLVESMLFLARDPTSLENDFSEVSMKEVITDQLDAASYHIDSKNITIQVIEHASPIIFTSSAILTVVFGNLLRNAVQHSESKEIQISLNSDGFSIKDFGRGIPEELKNRMFERYSSEAKGAGIGLMLVKRLCDHFGWKLSVDTNPGLGTTITVTFTQALHI